MLAIIIKISLKMGYFGAPEHYLGTTEHASKIWSRLARNKQEEPTKILTAGLFLTLIERFYFYNLHGEINN